MALLECNTALSPELVPARQRQGEGGEPASVDALADRRLRADLPVGYVAEVHLRHLDSLSGRKDDPAAPGGLEAITGPDRSEEHTSELQSLMRISYAVFCLQKKKEHNIAQTACTDQDATLPTYKNYPHNHVMQ